VEQFDFCQLVDMFNASVGEDQLLPRRDTVIQLAEPFPGFDIILKQKQREASVTVSSVSHDQLDLSCIEVEFLDPKSHEVIGIQNLSASVENPYSWVATLSFEKYDHPKRVAVKFACNQC
jgi:hypothetical protein